jgi:hypothetical protein
MKLVNESLLEFEQGRNPYDTMGIGANRPFSEGDQLEALFHLSWEGGTKRWIRKLDEFNPMVPKRSQVDVQKGIIYKIRKIYGTVGDTISIENPYKPTWFTEEEIKQYFKRV